MRCISSPTSLSNVSHVGMSLKSRIGIENYGEVRGISFLSLRHLHRGWYAGYTLGRAFCNRQTAGIHRLMLSLMDSAVKADTGQNLRWRHIHSGSLDHYEGICLWIADFHEGQALGMYKASWGSTSSLTVFRDWTVPQGPSERASSNCT